MCPTAIEIHVTADEYEAYNFEEWTLLDKWFDFNSFSPAPFGYKVIKQSPPGAASPQPGAAPPSGGQAQRPIYDGRRQ